MSSLVTFFLKLTEFISARVIDGHQTELGGWVLDMLSGRNSPSQICWNFAFSSNRGRVITLFVGGTRRIWHLRPCKSGFLTVSSHLKPLKPSQACSNPLYRTPNMSRKAGNLEFWNYLACEQSFSPAKWLDESWNCQFLRFPALSDPHTHFGWLQTGFPTPLTLRVSENLDFFHSVHNGPCSA